MKLDNQIILIEWDYSFAASGLWEDKDGLEPLPYAHCSTVGFLVDAQPESVTIIATDSQHQVLGRLTIPTKAIRKIRQLRVGRAAITPKDLHRLV